MISRRNQDAGSRFFGFAAPRFFCVLPLRGISENGIGGAFSKLRMSASLGTLGIWATGSLYAISHNAGRFFS